MPISNYLIPSLLCFSASMLSGCNNDNTNSTTTDTDTTQAPSVLAVADDDCDLDNVQLLDFTPWQRENGYWVGDYTLLGADGTPQVSSRWPYQYDNYQFLFI